MASLLGKHKIAVDTTTLADGDSIASYLVSSAGDLLTSTTVGGIEALDVYQQGVFAEDSAHTSGDLGQFILAVRNDSGSALAADGDYIPLSTDADGNLRVSASIDFAGDYAEDSAHVSGDVGLFSLAVRRDARTSGTSADGDYASFNINAVGELWVHDEDVKTELVAANASLDAIESDTGSILTELLDQGTTLDSIDSDTGNILTELLDQGTTLDGIASDISDILTELLDQGTTLDSILSDTSSIDSTLTALSKAEDAVHSSGDQGIQALAVRKDASGSNAADGDYTSLLTWSEGSLKVVDTSNAAILQQRIAVEDTATQLPASALSSRRSLLIQNVGSKSIWVGSATVTDTGATAGIEVPKSGFIELEVGPAVAVYAIAASGETVNVSILEMA